MTEDLIQRLRDFQQRTAGFQDILARAQIQLRPDAEATDGTGMIKIALAPDGIPRSIEVDADWLSAIDPEQFTTAVTEAFQRAASTRIKGWARTIKEEAEQPPAPVEEAGPAAAGVSDILARAARTTPRPLDVLADDMMRALKDIDETVARSPLTATGSGTDDAGRLRVTISGAGLVSCDAAPRWLRSQSGSSLTSALAQALAAARIDLEGAARVVTTSSAGPDQLIIEAIATLSDRRWLTSS